MTADVNPRQVDTARALARVRCWLRGKRLRLRTLGRARWNGHCWGHDGACMDCGWDR